MADCISKALTPLIGVLNLNQSQAMEAVQHFTNKSFKLVESSLRTVRLRHNGVYLDINLDDYNVTSLALNFSHLPDDCAGHV